MGEGISHVCQGHMIFACDVSAYGVVIIILVCDVSGMCGGISQVCQGHMILACDVSECVVVIMILICDVSGMCGGISQVCQGRKKTKMTYVTQTG